MAELEIGKGIQILVCYGQGLDLTGAVCRIINTTGELPEGVLEKTVHCLTSKARDTMMVRVEHIDGDLCEAKVGSYCRLRKWYPRSWKEAMFPPEEIYKGLFK